MVRLKEGKDSIQLLRSVFQFHYGTIKRQDAEQVDSLVSLFQFHYGTIKRNG
mgnify:CR=1 FL=1